MDSLRSVLPKVLRKRGLHAHAEAAQVSMLAERWLKTALPTLSDQIHVERLSHAVLTVGVGHPIVSQECTPLLPGLKEYLKREVPTAKIEEIRVVRAR